MKAYIVQPYYSLEENDIQSCFDGMLALLESIKTDADIIVLPEYCDIPAARRGKSSFHKAMEEYNEKIKEKAKQTAKRCHSLLFFNAADRTPTGWRNTTYALDREGNVVYKYYKAHPAPSEVKTEKEGGNEVDVSYSYEFRQPDVVEIEGIRFGFMTCYDFYFYEGFAPLARRGVDVVIGCSHQRTDTHEALSIINRFLCYHTNAYLVRASVSLGADSSICGCSSVITPEGEVLVDMKSKVGVACAEFDPHKKYYKPAGFRGQPKAHYEYIEEGRRPWLYRNGGAGVAVFDKYMPYPRLCAHRGYRGAAPENTLPAFGAAVALGAKEIALELCSTKDGVLVVVPDGDLSRVCDGTGRVKEYSYRELCSFDFGAPFGEAYRGLRPASLEEVLEKLGGRAVMNIHLPLGGADENEKAFERIAALVEKYDCVRHVYFTSESVDALLEMRKRSPYSACCLEAREDGDAAVQKAIEYKLDKVQFVSPAACDRALIDRCHENGIVCNCSAANDGASAKELFDRGIDCVLTDEYHRVKTELGKL